MRLCCEVFFSKSLDESVFHASRFIDGDLMLSYCESVLDGILQRPFSFCVVAVCDIPMVTAFPAWSSKKLEKRDRKGLDTKIAA